MRIVFFGSGHGVPEANRKCASILIEIGERRYFFDMGSQSIETLITKNMAVESVKGIFITHMHGDHTDGLISFVDLCTWKFKEADPDIFLPEPFERSVSAIKEWQACLGSTLRPFRFHPVKEGVLWEDGFIRVSAYKTMHTGSSYAYLIEGEGKRVLYTGDLKNGDPKEDFPYDALKEGVDLAICEAAHFEATKYLPIFEQYPNVKQICITHYATQRIIPVIEFQKASPIPVVIATDGLEFNL